MRSELHVRPGRVVDAQVDVFVVGAGPTGMAVSLLLQKERRDLTVAVADMRKDPLRIQILNNYGGRDRRLFERMSVYGIAENGSYQIKDVERKMRSRLNAVARVGGDRFKAYIPYRVESIDKAARVVTLVNCEDPEQRQRIGFRYIVLADGAKRKGLEMMGEDLSSSHKVCKTQPYFKHAGLIELRSVEKKVASASMTNVPDHKFAAVMKQLAALPDPDEPARTVRAWTRPYLPLAYCIVHGKRRDKLKLNCEVPECVINERDPVRKRALLVSWGKCLLAILQTHKQVVDPIVLLFSALAGVSVRELGAITAAPAEQYTEADFSELHASHKHDAAHKARLRALTTTMKRDRIKQLTKPLPGCESDSMGAMIAVGDVAALPFFINANGSRIGMYEADALVKAIGVDGEFDAAQFERDVGVELDRSDEDAYSTTSAHLHRIAQNLKTQARLWEVEPQDSAILWPALKAEMLRELAASIDAATSVEARFLAPAVIRYRDVTAQTVVSALRIMDAMGQGPKTYVECLKRERPLVSSDRAFSDKLQRMQQRALASIQQRINNRLRRDTPLSTESLAFIMDAIALDEIRLTDEQRLSLLILACEAMVQADVERMRPIWQSVISTHAVELFEQVQHLRDLPVLFYRQLSQQGLGLSAEQKTACLAPMLAVAIKQGDNDSVVELMRFIDEQTDPAMLLHDVYKHAVAAGYEALVKQLSSSPHFHKVIPKHRFWFDLAGMHVDRDAEDVVAPQADTVGPRP